MNPTKQRKNSWEEYSPYLGLWVWDYLTDLSMPTTQRLDGEDKDNQRTPQLLVITTQE